MFVERNVGSMALQVRDVPRVNHDRKVQSLVVEEELVRLILELNPQVRLDANLVVNGRRVVSASDLATAASAIDQTLVSETAIDVTAPFDPATADYGEDDNVRALIRLLPSPQTNAVNPMYRERLLRYFDRYAKHRLPTVAQLLRRYQGLEQALFSSLVEEFGPEPTLSDHDYFHEGLPPLPEGWSRVESTRGDIYYRNVRTKEVSWSRPRNERVNSEL